MTRDLNRTCSGSAQPRPRRRAPPGVRLELLAGAAIAVFLALPTSLSAQEAPSGTPSPASQPTPEGRPAPGEPGEPGEEKPGEVQPIGPVQPVRTFDPVPLPGELQPSAPATTESVAPVLPAAPITAGGVQGGTASPIVPGAAEAGRVVPDNRGLYGRDFFPAIGASVIAAAGFRASAGLQVSYDTNANRIPNDVELDPELAISRGDWILRPDLNIGVGRDVGQQLFYFNADFGRDFFMRNDGRDQNSINLNGGVEWRLGASCSGQVQGGWVTRETGAQGFFLGLPGTTKNTDFLFNASCNRGAGLVPSFFVAVGQVRFEPEFREISNADYWSLGGSLGYQLNPSLQVGVQVSQQSSSFLNQPLRPEIDPDGEVVSLDALAISGFASYVISASVNANVTLGWTKTSDNDPLIRDFSGLTGNVSIAYAGPRYGLAFNFGRDVSLGNTEGANLRIRSTIGLTGNYRLSPQVTLGTGFSYDKDDNRGDPRGVSFFNLFDQNFWRAFANANYRANDRLSFNLGYRYEARTDQVVSFEGLPDLALPGFHSHVGEFGLRFQFR